MFFLFSLIATLPMEVETPKQSVFEVSSKKSLDEIREELRHHATSTNSTKAIIEIDLNEKQGNGLLCLNQDLKAHGQYLGYPRPYETPLTKAEQDDIRFIVTFLANHSLFSLATHKSELQAAGDRIDHIHPLKFFGFVFSNEDLKVCIRNIRGNGWVWKDFSGGIKQSLTTEAKADNLKKEHIYDFAKKVNLDPRWIMPSIQNKNWDEFIDILIAKIPRDGDHDRYRD